MAEEKKPRKQRADKGVPRGPKAILERRAPVQVRIVLKSEGEVIEFGCARRWVESGFHVFVYPCPSDPYQQTRREFAVSEIREIEVTEYPAPEAASPLPRFLPAEAPAPAPSQKPVIRNARANAISIIDRMASSDGPIAIDEVPGLQMGTSL